MRFLVLLLCALAGAVASAQTIHRHALPFLTPGSNLAQQGVVRIVNESSRAGTVEIHAIDDTGERFGPVTLEVGASQSRQFNSRDLEDGNAAKGLSGGIGDGEGNWRLQLETALDIHALAYLRTPDGFLTEMHSVVPQGEDERYHVLFFNPASNRTLASRLRIVNPHPERVAFTIRAIDADGMQGLEPVRFAIPAQAVRTFTSSQLEARLGDGEGKWRLYVSASRPVWVMNLMVTRSGHITNLSLPAPQLDSAEQPTPARALFWNGGFSETSANNGSVSGRMTVALTGGSFTADVVSAPHVRASNVPAGLTARFVRTNSTTVTLTLTGRARRHANANDVRDLTVVFADGAFEGGDAAGVERSTHRSLRVDFHDPSVNLAPANASEFAARVQDKKVVLTVVTLSNRIDAVELVFSRGGRYTGRGLVGDVGGSSATRAAARLFALFPSTGRWTYLECGHPEGSCGPFISPVPDVPHPDWLHRATMRFIGNSTENVPGDCTAALQFTSRTSGGYKMWCKLDSRTTYGPVSGTFRVIAD